MSPTLAYCIGVLTPCAAYGVFIVIRDLVLYQQTRAREDGREYP